MAHWSSSSLTPVSLKSVYIIKCHSCQISNDYSPMKAQYKTYTLDIYINKQTDLTPSSSSMFVALKLLAPESFTLKKLEENIKSART